MGQGGRWDSKRGNNFRCNKFRGYERNEKFPGPGNYDPAENIFSKISGKIHPEQRAVTLQEMPGPGQYDSNYEYTRNKSPKYTLGQKGKNDYGTLAPGPGTYQPEHIKTKAGVGLGKGDKGMKYGNPNPGPGTYDGDTQNVKYKTGNKFGFSKDLRLKEVKGNPVGPGQYDLPGCIPDVASYNYPKKGERKLDY